MYLLFKMTYISYNAEGLITSDCIFVKRGVHAGIRGHVVEIYDTNVDVLVKNSDGIIINVLRKDIVLKQRMFFRRKDIRNKDAEEKEFIKEFQNMNLKPDLSDAISALTL